MVGLPSGNLKIAMENGPFIDGLPIKNGDFPWLCQINRGYQQLMFFVVTNLIDLIILDLSS